MKQPDNVKQVEITQEVLEGALLWKATFFEGGLDVAMYRYDQRETMLNAIRQFYAEPLVCDCCGRSRRNFGTKCYCGSKWAEMAS